MKFGSYTQYVNDWNNFLDGRVEWYSMDEDDDDDVSVTTQKFEEAFKFVEKKSKPKKTAKAVATTEFGQITKWFEHKKFGFITSKNRKDIFFVQTEFTKNMKSLPRINQNVKMRIETNQRGGFVARDIVVV